MGTGGSVASSVSGFSPLPWPCGDRGTHYKPLEYDVQIKTTTRNYKSFGCTAVHWLSGGIQVWEFQRGTNRKVLCREKITLTKCWNLWPTLRAKTAFLRSTLKKSNEAVVWTEWIRCAQSSELKTNPLKTHRKCHWWKKCHCFAESVSDWGSAIK